MHMEFLCCTFFVSHFVPFNSMMLKNWDGGMEASVRESAECIHCTWHTTGKNSRRYRELLYYKILSQTYLDYIMNCSANVKSCINHP